MMRTRLGQRAWASSNATHLEHEPEGGAERERDLAQDEPREEVAYKGAHRNLRMCTVHYHAWTLILALMMCSTRQQNGKGPWPEMLEHLECLHAHITKYGLGCKRQG